MATEDPNKVADRIDHRTDILRQLLPVGVTFSSMVDVGCADGVLGRGMASRLQIPFMAGIDVKAESEFRIPEIVASVSGQPGVATSMIYRQVNADGKTTLPDACADLVVAMMVVHHFHRRAASLNEIRRLLKPGGYLFIREHDVDPNDTNLKRIIDVAHAPYVEKKDEYMTYGVHGHYMSKPELEQLLKLRGLELVNTHTYTEKNPQAIYHSLFRLSK